MLVPALERRVFCGRSGVGAMPRSRGHTAAAATRKRPAAAGAAAPPRKRQATALRRRASTKEEQLPVRVAAAQKSSQKEKRATSRRYLTPAAAAEASKLRNALLLDYATLSAAIKGEPRPGPRLRAFRRRLLRLARSAEPSQATVASAAASLLLYTEALSADGTPRDAETMEAAVEVRRNLIATLGRTRWDSARIQGGELVKALEELGVAQPRRLSVLHRLVSVAGGQKHGQPSLELVALGTALASALRRVDPEGACGVCLEHWAPSDRALVPVCGHAVHADCFWAMLVGPSVQSYRGRCRTCRAPYRWGPMARSNLRCMLAATIASSLRGAEPASLSAPEVAILCTRISQEVGEGETSENVWQELKRECSRQRVKAFKTGHLFNAAVSEALEVEQDAVLASAAASLELTT